MSWYNVALSWTNSNFSVTNFNSFKKNILEIYQFTNYMYVCVLVTFHMPVTVILALITH